MRSSLALLLALGCGVTVLPARAAILDTSFTETLVATIPKDVTGMDWAPDGSHRLFVLIKAGEVRIVENGVLLPTPFASISPIFTNSECGLIGIAFDPDFIRNQYVYFFVTVSASEQQIIRYRANGNIGEEPTVIVPNLPTAGVNHDGGAIGFGPDGKLYFAVGDNGTRRGIQKDLLSLASKVGRANRDGSVPTDNPFFDGDGLNNDYIWARGFRNPFTMTWQPATGQLFLNVVGSFYEQVFTPTAGDHGGWNLYESNQPAGYIKPVISYATNTFDSLAIAASGAARTNGIASFTLSQTHRLRPGAKITIAGVADSSFDGVFYVASVPTEDSFTVAQPGSDAISGGGTATSEKIGGCLTGATFWDSSAVPAPYRGNFFFTEFTFGRILRAPLDASNRVRSVDEWANQLTRVVDLSIGPDGDLYYVRLTGGLYRARYNFVEEAIVVSRLNVRWSEGGMGAFSVRLSQPPSEPRTLTVSRSSGDEGVSVSEGATLQFDAGNFDVPQRVVLAAAPDSDSLEDTARFRVASTGLTAELVTARVTDAESASILAVPDVAEILEGGTLAVQVSLSEPPSATEAVTVEVQGPVSAAVTELKFSSGTWSDAQELVLEAAVDDDTDDGDATVVLSSAKFGTRELRLTVRDRDGIPPSIEGSPVLRAVVGELFEYELEASGRPAPTFQLEQAPAGMMVDSDTGLLSWIPDQPGTELVTVRASNGIEPDATRSFEVAVESDEAVGGLAGQAGQGSAMGEAGHAGEDDPAGGERPAGDAGRGEAPGESVRSSGGCACRAPTGRRGGVEWLGAALAAVLAWRRRARG